jgi:hypothetical protein
MIKALINVGGERVAVLGLSGENMARLMADEPMLVDLSELMRTMSPGLRAPTKVLLVGGKDEDTIAHNLMAVHAEAQRRQQ